MITDFDTPLRFVRKNKHNDSILTYKTDYSGYILPYGYTLIEKRMYSHEGERFVPEVQERVSTQIFYKEPVENLYVKG